MKPFVYRWTELSTGKWYIGSRTAKGCHPDDGYLCSSKIVRPLIDANPRDWRREVLFLGGEEEDGMLAVEKETELLQKLDAKNDPMSYNQHNGGGKFSNVGMKMSSEQKAKLSAAMAGKKLSEEHRAKLSAKLKGRISPNKGKKLSEGSKAKIGLVWQGKKHSEESKARMSAAKKGKKKSEETKAKISAAIKGHTVSPETRAKQSAAKIGKTHSAETKVKMSNGQRRRREMSG